MTGLLLTAKKCSIVGHNCDNVEAIKKKKLDEPIKKWVPKNQKANAGEEASTEVQRIGNVSSNEVNEGDKVAVKDTPGPSNAPISSVNDGGWKVVFKKTTDRGRRPAVNDGTLSNSYQALIESIEDEEEELDPGDRIMTPYLS